MNPRRKAPKEEQLTGELSGDLATYEKFGLFQRAIARRTAYRYRGVLLLYQKFLGEDTPSLEASKIFLAHLRKQGYSPSTLRIYRAALKGFHKWRGENLVFPIKVPRHLAPYIEADVVARVLDLARENPRDHLALRRMSDAGLRREEVIYLQVKDISGNTIRIRGKGDLICQVNHNSCGEISEVNIDKTKCVGCANCVPICPMGAIYIADDGLSEINQEACVECYTCYRGMSTKNLPQQPTHFLRGILAFFKLRFQPDPDICPSGAITADDLIWPRILRRDFSDPQIPHESKGSGTHPHLSLTQY